jgi:hypothetical protein
MELVLDILQQSKQNLLELTDIRLMILSLAERLQQNGEILAI